MNTPGAVFISYRRSDSIAEAGRIYDKLVEAFGSARIFKDVDNIPYGADFVAYLDQAVAQCDVLMPLIGRTWLTATDAQGNRRLDDPHDFVRLEIAAALNRDILVLPILLNGAAMPAPTDLPDELQSLARRNAAQVRHDPDFHSDMRRLVSKLEDYFASRNLPTPANAGANDGTAQPAPSIAIATAQGGSWLIPTVLSGVNGILAIIDGISGAAPPSIVVGGLLGVAAIALTTRQLWAWGVAIAAQVTALVLCSQEIFYELREYGAVYPDALFVLVPFLALVTLLVLLVPGVRRSFR